MFLSLLRFCLFPIRGSCDMSRKKHKPGTCPSCRSYGVKKEEEKDLLRFTCTDCGYMYTINICSSDHYSQEWEASTLDSLLPDTTTPSSVKQTPTDKNSSAPDSPAPQLLRTYALSENQRGELLLTDYAHQLTSGGGKPGQGYSAVAFLARTFPSLGSEPDWPEREVDCSLSSQESLPFSDQGTSSLRTFQVSSLATAVGTSESSLKRWPTSGMAWHGGFSTADTSECRSADDVCSSLERSLQDILI